jgi:thiol-disulfide isomerase/thioredoxin
MLRGVVERGVSGGMLFAVLSMAALWPAAQAQAADAAKETDAKEAAAKLDEDYPRASLPDAVSGQDVCLESAAGKHATVLMCMSTECPISNEYVPTIVAIAQAYKDRGVAFLGINPSGGQELDEMAEYARQMKLPFPFLKDAGGKVSRELLYSVTPEARVFDSSGKLVYSGRIDDRYRRGGASDPEVSKDLEKALDEVLAGKPVSASRTRPVGCPIQVAQPQAAK